MWLLREVRGYLVYSLVWLWSSFFLSHISLVLSLSLNTSTSVFSCHCILLASERLDQRFSGGQNTYCKAPTTLCATASLLGSCKIACCGVCPHVFPSLQLSCPDFSPTVNFEMCTEKDESFQKCVHSLLVWMVPRVVTTQTLAHPPRPAPTTAGQPPYDKGNGADVLPRDDGDTSSELA